MGIHLPLVSPKLRPNVIKPVLVSLNLVALALPCALMGVTASQNKNVQTTPALHQDFPDSDDLPPTPEELEEKKREVARAAFIKLLRANALAQVESAAKSVSSPDPAALTNALGVEATPPSDFELEAAVRSAYRPLGDLDGDGISEAAFRWSRVERIKSPEAEGLGNLPGWILFFLSWDGTRWRVSELMTGDGLCGIETLDGIWPTGAIVVVEGLSSVPYPVVFRFQDHEAIVVWDSRSDESRYQGYARGTVEFQEREGSPPVMIASGRADPGVIRFSAVGDRGFDVATAYYWENGAYVPRKSEFEENEDYTIYRFLATLNMRDFRAAFSLIDAAEFLEGSAKTPEALRRRVEDDWPELIGNAIFAAVESPSEGMNQFTFELNREDLHYSYFPAFGKDGSLRLTGLERRIVE